MYWTEISINLVIYRFDINDEIASIMRPSLARVWKLLFFECEMTKSTLKNLLSWSPELLGLEYACCELSNNEETEFQSLRGKFPKLESIFLMVVENINSTDIDDILKENPQLKQIKIFSCMKLADGIFQSIAKYVPEIEK